VPSFAAVANGAGHAGDITANRGMSNRSQSAKKFGPRSPGAMRPGAPDAALREVLPPKDCRFPSALAIGGLFRLVAVRWSACVAAAAPRAFSELEAVREGGAPETRLVSARRHPRQPLAWCSGAGHD